MESLIITIVAKDPSPLAPFTTQIVSLYTKIPTHITCIFDTQDPTLPYTYTHREPWKSQEVLGLRKEMQQLKEEMNTLKIEQDMKDKRAANVLKRLVGEKDQEISELKKEITSRGQQIEELVKQLKQERIRSQLVEHLKSQLDIALNKQEEEVPAEDIPIGNNNADEMLGVRRRHRSLSQS